MRSHGHVFFLYIEKSIIKLSRLVLDIQAISELVQMMDDLSALSFMMFILYSIHSLAHPCNRTTLCLVTSKFIWSFLNTNIRKRAN